MMSATFWLPISLNLKIDYLQGDLAMQVGKKFRIRLDFIIAILNKQWIKLVLRAIYSLTGDLDMKRSCGAGFSDVSYNISYLSW